MTDQHDVLRRVSQLEIVGAKCISQGDIAGGIDAYRALTELTDNKPDAWYNLAYLFRCARQFDDAVDAYEKSLAVGIDRPEEVHINLAAIQSEHLNDSTAAEANLIAALTLNDGSLAARLNLGNLYEDLGQSDDAQAAYRSVLSRFPTNGRATARHSVIDIWKGNPERALVALKAALQNCPDICDQIDLQFALGQTYDALGQFDNAFACATSANSARAQLRGLEGSYNPSEQHSLTQQIIAASLTANEKFASAVFSPPIFICGMFRSGSTLIEQILSRHSRVTMGGELEIVPALISDIFPDFPSEMPTLQGRDFQLMQDRYVRELDRVFPAFDRITDKRPDNFLYVGLIKQMFPNAKIILTERNMFDNLVSVFFGDFDDSIKYSTNLHHSKSFYQSYVALAAHWKAIFPSDVFVLNYDDLLERPESLIRELVKFCDLEWDENCLTNSETVQSVRTLSGWQVRQPLHKKSSGRWRNYEKYLRALALI